MNGADTLVGTLLEGNVDVCFTNPGTSEMHFVAALDNYKNMRSIYVCLKVAQLELQMDIIE